jgi:hypothetical protein
MLKKSLSILLLSLLIFNMTGIFIVFKIEQAHIRKSIKHQIKAGIPEEELHIFNLSKVEYIKLDWVRPDIEFRKNKEMFDIVHMKSLNDSVRLYCVNDKEESILFAQLDKMIKKKMQQESNSLNSPINKVLKLFNLIYISNQTENKSLTYYRMNKKSYHYFTNLYDSPLIKQPSPPPKSV